MRVFLFLCSVVSFLVGCLILLGSQSAIHEIEGFLLFLIAATLLSGAAIVESLKPMKRSEQILGLLALKLTEQKEVLDKTYVALTKNEVMPPPIREEERYFLAIDGSPTGPYTVAEIQALANRGSIDAETKLAKVGDKVWQPLSSVLE